MPITRFLVVYLSTLLSLFLSIVFRPSFHPVLKASIMGIIPCLCIPPINERSDTSSEQKPKRSRASDAVSLLPHPLFPSTKNPPASLNGNETTTILLSYPFPPHPSDSNKVYIEQGCLGSRLSSSSLPNHPPPPKLPGTPLLDSTRLNSSTHTQFLRPSSNPRPLFPPSHHRPPSPPSPPHDQPNQPHNGPSEQKNTKRNQKIGTAC